jgi:hypothetical protein
VGSFVEFALKNRRIRSVIIMAILGVAIRSVIIMAILGVAAPYLGLGETEVQQYGTQLALGLGSLLVLVDYFAKLGPRGMLRVLGGAVGSLPVLYNVLHGMAAEGGIALDDKAAAEIATGLGALVAMAENMASAARPNEGTAAGVGKLRNRNP